MSKTFLTIYLISFFLLYGCSEKPISEKQKAIDAYKEKQDRQYIFSLQPEEIKSIDEKKEDVSLVEKEFPLTFYKKGVEYASQGKFEEAKKEFNKALGIYKFDDASNKSLAVLKDVDKGIISEDYAVGLFKGESYNFNGTFQQTIAELQKAIQINPNHVYAYASLGAIHFSLGEYSQAISHYQKSIQINSDSGDWYYALGFVYNALGQSQQAIEEFQKAIQIDPNYARAYAGLGFVYFSIGQSQQAISHYQKSIQINSDISDAYIGLGAVYQFLGQYQKAANYNQKAIAVNPGDWSAYFGLGVNHLYLDKFREAIPYFQKSIQIIPKLAQAHRGIGFANFSLGQYEEAREAFQKAKELFQSEENSEKTERMQEYLDKIKELVEE